MRTNIVIDDHLLAEAVRLSGARTKKSAVEQALRLLVERFRQAEAMRDLAGIGWDGDLDAIRSVRPH